MEKNLLQLNDRKGVSIMVGYVLLIAIAIALSTAVFFYLKLYLPDERPECDVDIKMTIDSAVCVFDNDITPTYSNVRLNITNKGLFKIEGAYIKIGDASRAFREDLNPANPLSLASACNGNNEFLNPGDKSCFEYTYNKAPNEIQEISVQPVVWINNEPVLCPESIVTRRVACTNP